MKRCVETSGDETKLRARVSTLVSCRNSLWEKKPMFLDHFSWWTIKIFMPSEFLVVCTSVSCFLNMSYLLGNKHYGRVWKIAHRSFLGQDLDNQRAALEVGGVSSHCLIALARFQKVQRAFHNPTFMGNCEAF